MFSMTLPQGVQTILSVLRQGGKRGVLVGGCVRDACMGLPAHDYDIATDATPAETLELFRDFRVLETGIKHGTVTILIDHEPFEVTTFRIDGDYRDHRRPDRVTFTTRLADDLARRDFTVNAMAFDGQMLIDPFGGQQDAQAHILRCVGDPDVRFNEDGLRILRALRFAAVLDFVIEPQTSDAIHRCRNLLEQIAVERLFAELRKLLGGQNAYAVLRGYADVMRVFLPELSDDGIEAIRHTPADGLLRLALLTEGSDAESALRRLRADKKTIRAVVQLHTLTLTDARHLLAEAGIQQAHRFADYAAVCDRIDADRQARLHVELDVLEQDKPCLSLRDLAVNGRDLQSLGLTGQEIGQALERLLEEVLSGRLPNERAALLDAAKHSFLQ
ncbi:MAG: tRNA nucleotidyltransferase [Clostridia bacterium]|nr:tRNA nucleotidyltransferase [Clostridia bacterium]